MARWRRAGVVLSFAALMVLGSGCSENDPLGLDADAGAPDGGWDTACGPNLEPHGPAALALEDSLIERSQRVGMAFDQSGGSARRSVLRAGVFSIVLERGADPEIAADNVFEDNTEDRVSFGLNLDPPPSFLLPPPP